MFGCTLPGCVRLWNNVTGALTHTFSGHSGAVTCLAMMADGVSVVSGSEDQTLRCWFGKEDDADACRCVLTGHKGPVRTVCVLSDGTVVSGGDDAVVRLWSYADGKMSCAKSLSDHAKQVLHVAPMNGDDAAFVSASADRAVYLWK